MPIAEEIAQALRDNNAVLIATDTCLSCSLPNDEGRFLLFKIKWRLQGKEYPSIGLFLCRSCTIIDIDYKKVAQNLRYQLLEFNSRILE